MPYRNAQFKAPPPPPSPPGAIGPFACTAGIAGQYPCQGVSLAKQIPYSLIDGNVRINGSVGSCMGGTHIVDVHTPVNPMFAGCDSLIRSLDTQCIDYGGPDTDRVGKELCFASNIEKFDVADLDNLSYAFACQAQSNATGVYPFLPSGTLLVSETSGLFLLEMQQGID